MKKVFNNVMLLMLVSMFGCTSEPEDEYISYKFDAISKSPSGKKEYRTFIECLDDTVQRPSGFRCQKLINDNQHYSHSLSVWSNVKNESVGSVSYASLKECKEFESLFNESHKEYNAECVEILSSKPLS
ncbi:hypothetical protein [Thalassotalea marina]|uniref:Lipoprotein n=1 Tax=Thalassotalea marina TaxID=1673741 RepID=A0A919BRD3_9GAMM|nr:hypothetical protein [Thalassotalea marina]GHG07812.1 hypothetical protein GCM10017161_41950 [Thalassotalea marina]